MAFNFNGADQHLYHPNAISSMPMTFSARVNTADSKFEAAMSQGNTDGPIYYNLLASVGLVARVEHRGSSADITAFVNGGTLTQNQWGSLGAIFLSNTSRSVFFDGTLSSPNTTVLSGTPSQNMFSIAARRRNTIDAYFNGILSDAAIWSVALTDAEIASLAKGFSPRRIRPQSLVFYAPLLRNLQDLKGGLALTAVNSPTVADHPRVY